MCLVADPNSPKPLPSVSPHMLSGDRLAEGITLQDASDEWCSPLLLSSFPAPCEGKVDERLKIEVLKHHEALETYHSVSFAL